MRTETNLPGAPPTPSGRETLSDADSISTLIRSACRILPFRTPALGTVEERLLALLGRLGRGQLQLAVVGQFKRGKSTLLNALLGAPILPSAVTPLTAIPTLLGYGEQPMLATRYADGRIEQLTAENILALRGLLRDRVTEDGNPHNRRGIARVEAKIDARLLKAGIVLIDTPGIGSTFTHNTEAAKAALPECDMALFVVSPDPPITEAELAYLKDVRQVSKAIIVVLNKIDLVEGSDRERSERFLHDTIAEAGIVPEKFFCVSAHQALAAKSAGNNKALVASGLPDLENFLLDFVHTRRRQVWRRRLPGKAASLVGEAIFEIEARLAALRMPVGDLSDRLARFTAAGEEFERERKAGQDMLAGDRTRLLSDLDEKSAALRQSANTRLMAHVDDLLAKGASETELLAQLEGDIPRLFQSEFDHVEAEARDALTALLGAHQERADSLIGEVRRVAASLLDIPYTAPAADEAFQVKKVPYWITVPRQSLIAAPGFLEGLLPAKARLKRTRARLHRHIAEIVTRNMENLRWTLRQNLEASIRTFQSRLDAQLQQAQEATRSAMEIGLHKRYVAQETLQAELTGLEAAIASLKAIKANLEES